MSYLLPDAVERAFSGQVSGLTPSLPQAGSQDSSNLDILDSLPADS